VFFSVRSRQNPIFNPALNGKAQEWQQNGGEFDKPLLWVHFCVPRSLLSP
jgi:hypothetical protein